MSVLAVLEHDQGMLAPASGDAITFGRDVAAQLGVACEALLIGGGDAATTAALAEQAAQIGAATVHTVAPEWLTDYAPEAYGDAVAAAIEALSPGAVVACGTDRGNETLAHAAAAADLPFVANALSAAVGDEWEIMRVQWGGSLSEDVRLSSSTPIMSVAAHTVEAPTPDPTAVATTVPLTVTLDAAAARTMIAERVTMSDGLTLATAPVVIGGGRGVGSADGFGVLEALAEKLGGVVGCSRAVTNNGWRPHADQVGQTGTRIAPQIYIACGISGAIQHWVGAKAAKTILAINTDPDANMVVKADYAVIGDLFEVVPAITDHD